MPVLQLPSNFGSELARLRLEANVKQATLAGSIQSDPSRVSRIESGEYAPSSDEVSALLSAIGTSRSTAFLEYLSQEWRETPRPSFDHPDRTAIWQAELALQGLSAFVGRPDVPGILVAQAQLLRQSVHEATAFLLDKSHAVAFLGDNGVGKTTAACALAGLVLPDGHKPRLQRIVLATGQGGTTVCEVRLQVGPRVGIRVDPLPDAEVHRLVSDLALGVTDAIQKQEKTQSEGGGGVTREVDRALRNMAKLNRIKTKGEDGKVLTADPLQELALRSGDAKVLHSEVSAKLALWTRTKRELWFEGQDSDAMTWLKTNFSAINNGLVDDVSLPKCIDIFLKHDLIQTEGLRIDVVDTKGIDQTAIRPDLEAWVTSHRTIIVLCSPFRQAPSVTMQQIIEHAIENSHRPAIDRMLVLVLPQNGDAIGMKDDFGEPVSTEEEGLDLKKDQVVAGLGRIGASEVPVLFFNAVEDSVDSVKKELITAVRRLRRVHALRIERGSDAARRLMEQEKEQLSAAAQDHVRKTLDIFIRQHESVPRRKRRVMEALLKQTGLTHQRAVWASVRRNGAWSNFDAYYHIGTGAAVDAKQRAKPIFDSLRGIIKNQLGNEDLAPAHGLLRELETSLDSWEDEFIESGRRAGTETYRPSLMADHSFWDRCERWYGTAQVFRARVCDEIETWFSDEAQSPLDEHLERRLDRAWKSKLIGPLKTVRDELRESASSLVSVA